MLSCPAHLYLMKQQSKNQGLFTDGTNDGKQKVTGKLANAAQCAHQAANCASERPNS
jgi:hypothetical protein